MITFIGILAVGIVLILLLLFRPLIWRSSDVHGSREQLNASIYREELAKLDLERKTAVIDQASYDQSYAELRLRLSQDAGQQEPEPVLRSPWRTVVEVVDTCAFPAVPRSSPSRALSALRPWRRSRSPTVPSMTGLVSTT